MTDVSDAKPVQKAAARKLQDLLKSTTTSALAKAVKPASAERVSNAVPPATMAKMLAEDGVLPSDPLYRPLVHLETLLEKAAAGADALNTQVRATGEAEVDRVRSAVVEVEAESVVRMAAVLDHSVRSMHRGMQWRTGALLGAALSVAVLTGFAAGHWWGWSSGQASVRVAEQQVAAAFRWGPEVARTWGEVMVNNDIGQALEQCSGGALFRVNGRKACRVPLWLEGDGVPEQR